MRTTMIAIAMASGLAIACTSSRGEDTPGDGGIGIGDDTQGGIDDGGIADSAGDDAPKFDTPDGAGASGDEGGIAAGCKKVDFLFVVDNSGSMADEQSNLTASFPGFVSAITEVAGVDDFHILVTDTDGAVLDDFSCGGLPGCCDAVCGTGAAAKCDGASCPGDACGFTGGAGRTVSGAGQSCAIQGGQRYLVAGQPDLGGTFACMAEVGTMGNGDERQAEAITLAIGPELAADGACNAGFLRDDALLVVTLITDEEDSPNDGADGDPNSPGDPASWAQAIVDAKKGSESAVVFLALVGDTDQPNAMCSPIDADTGTGAEPAPRLRELAASFTYGSSGSVCAADYSPFFADAVGVIDSACDEFVPVG